MITVYWSPWIAKELYPEYNLCFDDPKPLLESLKSKINHDNKHDNFFKCPAFINYAKNIYTLNAPFDIDANLVHGTFNHPLYHLKSPSMTDGDTINIATNWIFFADKSLNIETMPAFMHKKSSDYGFYVPGTYDINKWFRPVEFATQLWPGESSVKLSAGEPMIYLKLNTDEPVQFKRFYLADDIRDFGKGCIHMKQLKSIKSLNKLYSIFQPIHQKLLLKRIKNNLTE